VDLGVLREDDTDSQATGINSRGQVVGISCEGPACRGFLYEDGVMKDVNRLIANSAIYLVLSARHIDDAGRITGHLLVRSTGRVLAYVASPRRSGH
jgi:probable HAF family extracellular repeat protein